VHSVAVLILLFRWGSKARYLVLYQYSRSAH